MLLPNPLTMHFSQQRNEMINHKGLIEFFYPTNRYAFYNIIV